jgi:tyrosine-protein kinase Etk/Wzc
MCFCRLSLASVFLRRGIESPEAIEDIGLNVYASIPVSEWLSKKIEQGRRRNKNDNGGFLALENPADLAIEAIRSLRTSLHFAMLEAQNNVLMISEQSNVGKTFVSSNLAAVISQTGKKVLFVDADMRRGYTHKCLIINLRMVYLISYPEKLSLRMQQSRLQLQDLTLFLEDRYHQIQPNY